MVVVMRVHLVFDDTNLSRAYGSSVMHQNENYAHYGGHLEIAKTNSISTMMKFFRRRRRRCRSTYQTHSHTSGI